jgi:HK97 family phage portal protein
MQSVGRGGWFPIVVREPFTGAWQQNQEIRGDTALSYFAVFACTTLIASDIGKLRLRLVAQDGEGIWRETTSAAFSPVLRRPNAYQSIIKFVEQWIVSKLIHGNTYVLKERDDRGVVRALFILDPTRVRPLVSPDGAVFYDLSRDPLAGLEEERVAVPASEVIHDLMVPLFHPLIGVSPLFACGLSALEGLRIQGASSSFFANGCTPGGVLTAPGAIADETAKRLKEYWDSNYSGANVGKVAVLGDGLKYEAMSVTAVDAQLIEQLKWTAETVCACFHVPPAMIGISPPPYGNLEQLVQQYYNAGLQSLIVSLEKSLDEGLELPAPYGTELDTDDLIWMDTATKTKAASDAIGAGALSPDEARKKYYGLGSVEGGDTPFMQQQMFSLRALAERDAEQPFAKPTPALPPAPPADDDELDDDAVGKMVRDYFEASL